MRRGHQLGERGRGDPGGKRVGATGQHDRHAGAKHDSSRNRTGKINELLGQHVAGFEIRHEQYVGIARNRRDDAFRPGGVRTDGVVEGPRTVDLGAMVCSRAAMMVSTAASSVAGIEDSRFRLRFLGSYRFYTL